MGPPRGLYPAGRQSLIEEEVQTAASESIHHTSETRGGTGWLGVALGGTDRHTDTHTHTQNGPEIAPQRDKSRPRSQLPDDVAQWTISGGLAIFT